MTTPILALLLLAPLTGAAEDEPGITVKRIEAILTQAKPHLVRVTGLAWPEKIAVERTDPAGMQALLLDEFLRDVAVLYPERPESSRKLLAQMLARSFARVVRAKYGLITKKLHVASTALDRLPEGLDPDRVLTLIVVHEAVHAMDDAAFDLSARIAGASDAEAHRALRMVIEGRAEHYAAAVAPTLGVPKQVDEALAALRDPGEALVRSAGRKFIAALIERDPKLAAQALTAPPRSTSVVFHPSRFGRRFDPPDAVAALAAAKLGGTAQAVSELNHRKILGTRLTAAEVEKMFAGYLAGAAVATPDGARFSLTEHESAATATVFLVGLMAAEGQAAAKDARYATGPLRSPDGRTLKWWAWTRGARVLQVEGPPDLDLKTKLGPALAPLPRKE
jgi:hypothetical protein